MRKYNIKSRPQGFIGHKQDCQCGVCKARRGETKGKNNANFKHNKIRNHKCKDCREKTPNRKNLTWIPNGVTVLTMKDLQNIDLVNEEK